MKNELLSFINECNDDEELKETIDTYIDAYTLISADLNPIGNEIKTIGRIIDINPTYELNVFNSELETNNKWYGFIPEDIKIVYSTTKNNGKYYNEGNYYYIKDRQYLYDFANSIKGEKIDNFGMFLDYLYTYMSIYFNNSIGDSSRDDINKLLLDSKGLYYEPNVTPDIKDFKDMGCAMCSEYSTMAQNILSIFGYDVLLIFDDLHAYNIYFNTKDDPYILDFQSGINVYNYNGEFLGQVPYMSKIDNYDDKLLENVLYNNYKFELDDIELYKYAGQLIPMNCGYKRFYGADNIKKYDQNDKISIYLK